MSINFISGKEIENQSLRIIDEEAENHNFSVIEWPVVRRMVHASADFSILPLLVFSKEPVLKGIEALKKGASIITDTNMLKSGISKRRLYDINPAYKDEMIFCNVSNKKTIEISKKHNLPRSIFNMRSLKEKIHGGVVCIGNAPTALWEVCRLVEEEKIIPSLLIAMPVGFVNVVESKELVKKLSIPYILMEGRRGGTPFAVAALNAIIILGIADDFKVMKGGNF